MKFLLLPILVLLAALSGCVTAPQTAITMKATSVASSSGRIGVAMTALPKVDTQFPGAACLLCYAAASLGNRSMTTAVQTWSADEFLPLKAEVIAILKSRGVETVLIDEPLVLADLSDRPDKTPNFARKDFTSLAKKYQISRLVLIDINALGVWRNYASYIPTGAPFAVVKGSSSLIDLSSHALDGYLPLDLSRGAEGNWDEAPNFPGIANAYFQVIELTKDSVKKSFNP